jgi:NAD(P)-dependent dehydrogenase (short-subunit alcohol dehydrogenase family)
MAGRLQDRVALITGGGTGIGRATAQLFAREGARVAVCGRNEATLRETADLVSAEGGQALAVRADVTNEADVQAAVAATVERFGGLDVLVANAGWEGPLRPLTDVGVEEWDQLMAVNVRGPFLCAKHSIPHLRARPGAIVVVSSDSAFVAGPGMVPYCTSKGAVVMFTRALAVDLWADKIRVNSICPSNVDTQMLWRGLEASGGRADEVEPDYLAPPELLASEILFLASDESRSINGHALVADYGGSARTTWAI